MKLKITKNFLKKIQPTSDKSGAAMRASPIGLIKDINTLKRVSRVQASITHNTPDGLEAAEAAALMVHYFYYDLGHKDDVGLFLNETVKNKSYNWDSDYNTRIKSKGWMSVKAAITAIKRNNSLKAILNDVCWMGGDVDTAAVVAISAASCSNNIKKNLPEELYWGLENTRYGREYLDSLGDKLFTLFPKQI